jgi:hypothetical protein
MRFGGKVDTVDAVGSVLRVSLEEGIVTLEVLLCGRPPVYVNLVELDAALDTLREHEPRPYMGPPDMGNGLQG